MRARKRDKNEPEIVNALRKIGCTVSIMSEGNGFPDLVVSLGRKLALIEVKESEKARLTEKQIKWHEEWKHHSNIVWTKEQALEIITTGI